jgi:hypothetical protein
MCFPGGRNALHQMRYLAIVDWLAKRNTQPWTTLLLHLSMFVSVFALPWRPAQLTPGVAPVYLDNCTLAGHLRALGQIDPYDIL